MGWCWNSLGWGWPWGGAIMSLVFSLVALTLLGLGIVWMVRQLRHRPLPLAAGGDPLEIARRRLAAGEITIAEFVEIRDRLQR